MFKHWGVTFITFAALALSACGGGGGGGGEANASAAGSVGSSSSSIGSSSSSSASSGSSQSAQPTAVGVALGAPVSGVIGVAGGQLSTADGGLTLSVPAGALSKNETISIQEISNEAHGANGHAYRISPEGLKTQVAMTITMHYDAASLQGSSLGVTSIAYQDSNRLWHAYTKPARDAAAQTISVQTSHFSDWAYISGARLLPMTGALKVGKSLQLHVETCEHETDEESELTAIVVSCVSNPMVNLGLGHWTATSGTLTADADRSSGAASFTAPAKKPPRNPVAVSVEYQEPFDSTLQILVSNIEILDDAVEDTPCAWMRTATTLAVDVLFQEYQFSGTNEFETARIRQSGRLVGLITSRQQLPDYGFWAGTLSQGEAHLDDYRYTPGNEQTLTVKGDALFEGPDAKNEHMSGVAISVDYRTCKYILHENVNVMATTHSSMSDVDSVTAENVGQFSVFNRTITAEQGAARLVKGAMDVRVRNVIDGSMDVYVPGGLMDSSLFTDDISATGWATVAWKFQSAE